MTARAAGAELAAELDRIAAAMPEVGAERAEVAGQLTALRCHYAGLLAGIVRGERAGDVQQLAELADAIGWGAAAIADADAMLANAAAQIDRMADLVLAAPVPAAAAAYSPDTPASIH